MKPHLWDLPAPRTVADTTPHVFRRLTPQEAFRRWWYDQTAPDTFIPELVFDPSLTVTLSGAPPRDDRCPDGLRHVAIAGGKQNCRGR